jgi:hypothetical protein
MFVPEVPSLLPDQHADHFKLTHHEHVLEQEQGEGHYDQDYETRIRGPFHKRLGGKIAPKMA